MATSSLADLNLVTRPIAMAHDRVVDVPAALTPLFPNGGLRRGSFVSVGSASVVCALLAKASAQGLWCSIVDVPVLFLEAIASFGGRLERCVVVRNSGTQSVNVLASLIDSSDLVVSGTEIHKHADARRLVARTQEAGNVLMTTGEWPVAPFMNISMVSQQWRGIGRGHGLLRSRVVELQAVGRGAASKERRIQVWLPNNNGEITEMDRNENACRLVS